MSSKWKPGQKARGWTPSKFKKSKRSPKHAGMSRTRDVHQYRDADEDIYLKERG